VDISVPRGPEPELRASGEEREPGDARHEQPAGPLVHAECRERQHGWTRGLTVEFDLP
jgi:hypothetical protein